MSTGQTTFLKPISTYVLIGLVWVSVTVMAEPITTVQQASEIAQQLYGGQVVKAEEADVDQKKVFIIRVVNEGRVRDVMIDPDDGSVLNP